VEEFLFNLSRKQGSKKAMSHQPLYHMVNIGDWWRLCDLINGF